MEPEPEPQAPDGGKQLHAQVEGEVIQSLTENPMDEVPLIEEDNLIKNSDFDSGLIRKLDTMENSAEPVLDKAEVNKDDNKAVAAVSVPDGDAKATDEVKNEVAEGSGMVGGGDQLENGNGHAKVDDGKKDSQPEDENNDNNHLEETPVKQEEEGRDQATPSKSLNNSFMFDYTLGGDDSGSEEEQAAFMKELENFHKEKSLEFKPPKFYGEGLNCLKLWRQVTRLGGYEQVTSCKLWRQVGESFKPPKTCTTVSWTFRNFYEKALLEYEKHKIETGEFQGATSNLSERIATDSQIGANQASGSGRARRESATRAMQGWHSQRLLGNGEIADPIIKDKASISVLRKDKNIKSSGSAKRKRTPSMEQDDRMPTSKVDKLQTDTMVVDVGAPADWVKINVRRTKDCYEVYALVPGLLREEVQVQSDPAGRLIISGEPEQADNPWGVTPFKKVISLPSRIDPHQTSAVVTLHGQLFVRAPFEQSKS